MGVFTDDTAVTFTYAWVDVVALTSTALVWFIIFEMLFENKADILG